jgi:hypothetical protein
MFVYCGKIGIIRIYAWLDGKRIGGICIGKYSYWTFAVAGIAIDANPEILAGEIVEE